MTTALTPDERLNAVAQARPSALTRYWRKNWPLFLLMLPGLLHIIMIQYMPMFGMVIAFKKYRFNQGIFGSAWVGFDNFKFLFGSSTAWNITFNTITMNFWFILTGTLAALTLAVLLNEIYKSRFTQVYQVTLFLPFFVGSVILGYFAQALFKTDGLLNTVLRSLNQESISFYLEPKYWRYILIAANLWSGVGFGTILYLSGILGILPEYYEAARIDGASKWQEVWFITIPMIRYLIVIQILLAVGKIFFANFGLFYFVPQTYINGQLLAVTDVIDTFVFRAFQGGYGSGGASIVNLGLAAAAGFYQSVVGFILIVTANLLVRRISPEHALF